MSDKKSSFSLRFWSTASRRQPATQTTTPPQATTKSSPTTTPKSRSVNRSTTSTSNSTSTATRKVENKTPSNESTRSITNPTSTTPPTTENKNPDSQSISNTTNPTSSTSSTDENKTLDSQSISNATDPTSATSEKKIPNTQISSSITEPASITPPTGDNKTLGNQSTAAANSPPNPTTPFMKGEQITDKQNTEVAARITPASTKAETSKLTATSFTSPTKEPQTSSPSRASNQSPSSSQPVTPSRRTTQSRSPPQPSSPSSETPLARPVPSSPSRVRSQTTSTPQRTSQPRSSYRIGSRTQKHTSSTNSSKESRRKAQEISNSSEVPTSISNENDPKPLASQQDPDDAKDDGVGDYNDQTMDGTSSKHNEGEVMPYKSSQLGTTTQNKDSSTINGGEKPLNELNANIEETKDVKEVVQATNTEANEEASKEVNDLLASKPGFKTQVMEKAEIPSTPEMHTKKQATKENLPTPSIKPTNATSQPKKRSTIPKNHNKSDPPIGEFVTSHKDAKDDISAFVNRLGIGDPESAIYDKPVSVITLAGENRGASMQMRSNSSKTERPIHIHRSYKINPDESVEATTDGEGSSKGKTSEDAKTTEDQPTDSCVNNNAQGINNSIVFNSSITERNPGVHMVVTHVPKEPIQSTDKTNSAETQKSELNMTRLDKLTYEPMVRRRCLRGLLLETSDSDPENPEKPRRHGCRVGCNQRDKENDMGVLRS